MAIGAEEAGVRFKYLRMKKVRHVRHVYGVTEFNSVTPYNDAHGFCNVDVAFSDQNPARLGQGSNIVEAWITEKSQNETIYYLLDSGL